MSLGQTPADDSEVLREGEYNFSINFSLARDDTISIELLLVHTELAAPVGHKLVVLNETALIKQKLDTFSRREFVLRVVLVDTVLTATEDSLLFDVVPALDEGLGLLGLSSEVESLPLDEQIGSRPRNISS